MLPRPQLCLSCWKNRHLSSRKHWDLNIMGIMRVLALPGSSTPALCSVVFRLAEACGSFWQTCVPLCLCAQSSTPRSGFHASVFGYGPRRRLCREHSNMRPRLYAETLYKNRSADPFVCGWCETDTCTFDHRHHHEHEHEHEHTKTHSNEHTHTHIDRHTDRHTDTHTHTNTNTHTHTDTSKRTHAQTHKHTNTQTHTHTHTQRQRHTDTGTQVQTHKHGHTDTQDCV